MSHLCQEAAYFNKVRGGITVPIESNYRIPRIRKLIQMLWMGLIESQEVQGKAQWPRFKGKFRPPAGGTGENAINNSFAVRPCSMQT